MVRPLLTGLHRRDLDCRINFLFHSMFRSNIRPADIAIASLKKIHLLHCLLLPKNTGNVNVKWKERRRKRKKRFIHFNYVLSIQFSLQQTKKNISFFLLQQFLVSFVSSSVAGNCFIYVLGSVISIHLINKWNCESWNIEKERNHFVWVDRIFIYRMKYLMFNCVFLAMNEMNEWMNRFHLDRWNIRNA